MKQARTKIDVVAERLDMSDEKRVRRLAELAELIVDPDWLDREALAELEKHEDEPASAACRPPMP